MKIYNPDGTMNKEAVNQEQREIFENTLSDLSSYLSKIIMRLGTIQTTTFDEETRYRVRKVINRLLNVFPYDSKEAEIVRLTQAKRWDINLREQSTEL